MKRYRITYTILGTEVIFPLFSFVEAENEEDAKVRFLASGNFYNTNDCRKIVIESIRVCK